MKRVVLITFLALTLVTGVAVAQHGGPGGPGGEHGPGGGGPDGGGLIVGSDGTVYVVQMSSTSAAPSFTLKAIRSTGTTAWTSTVSVGHLELSGNGNYLLGVSSTTATDGTVSSTITAISTASGSVAWTRTLSGRVGDLRPFSGGTYAVVVVPAATSGGTATRSLVAIGNDGSVLWTVSL